MDISTPRHPDTPPALSLDALACAINEDHAEVERMARTTLDRARAAGDKLLQAKAQVSQYAMLQKLDADAWRVVATTFQQMVAASEDDVVADGATTVARQLFTERLLRDILDLCPCQQDDVGGYLRTIRDGKGLKKLWFVSLEAFAEFGLRLDPEMLGFLLDPPSPWSDATDAMHAAQIRWILRKQGLSDAEARAQIVQWDAAQVAA
jgi:hypothetical protein